MQKWTVVVGIAVVGFALLACKKNEANTKKCSDPAAGVTDSESCEKCCKAAGSNGYSYVTGGECGCLGG